MDIVLATSDVYSKPALVTLKSVFINNRNVDVLNIHYVGNGLTENNKNLLIGLTEEYGRKIFFYEIPKECENIGGLLRTNPIVYSYCYFQDILPVSVNKVLLLEGDTIVVKDLTEMFNTDISEFYLAATDDLQSKYCKRRVGINEHSAYFNSGVMLINLKKMREDNFSEKITPLIKSGKAKFMYEVQDELNVMLENQVKILSPKYNCTTAIFLFKYKDMLSYRRPSTCCSEKEFEEAKKDPVIVHFTRNQIIQSRPWMEECNHPYREYYMKMREGTAAENEPLWKTDRNWKNRFAFWVYSKVSKKLVAVTLGVVRAFLYPLVLYKYILR
ncbi:MAG: glycosyltransferase family 8 protein [Clostridiaceae bacterium]|nr:glycosyltransferase family 8 protein [Clostridiaceae bacterium]